jgi:hypothetical protein
MLPYIQTDSTIGVQQTLLEVNKTDMKVDSDGRSWAKVEDGSGAIMKVEEAQKRLAAEIALKETPEERRLREERRQQMMDLQEHIDIASQFPSILTACLLPPSSLLFLSLFLSLCPPPLPLTPEPNPLPSADAVMR